MLKPVVRIGQKGLTEAVQAEIGVALLAHQLIKIHISAADKSARQAIIQAIITHHMAHLVQIIGHKVVFFKANNNNH